jgi:GMP synthase (glutamine-hydrolysing)
VRRLLLYKTGETDPRLVPEIGDYERWFTRVLGEVATLEVHRAFETPRHPLRGYHGLIVSGSPRSLVEPEPWMADAAGTMRDAADAGVPVLGVCFGHQLLGWAFGGQVRQNPNGWEVGTVEVELSEAGARDPLFAGLPRTLTVNQSHRDEVHALPAGVTTLAIGAHSPVQAIACGEHVRGVQFHPEMDAMVVRRIVQHRRAILGDDARARGREPAVDQLISQARDTPLAERVLANFVARFAGQSG